MDLKFRRNLPLLLLFITIVTFLVLGLGNQPIIAYTIENDGASDSRADTDSDLEDDVIGFFGLPTTENVEMIAPVDDIAGSVASGSVSGLDVYQAQCHEIAIDSADAATFQPDEG